MIIYIYAIINDEFLLDDTITIFQIEWCKSEDDTIFRASYFDLSWARYVINICSINWRANFIFWPFVGEIFYQHLF